ncbi:MAG TPA: hypothetical protein VF384_00495 [Planctomycetota bacterium]
MKVRTLLDSILQRHMTHSPPRWPVPAAAFVGVVWCYAALNVLVICTTPMLNSVVITLDVVDDASSAPIAGAAVGCSPVHCPGADDLVGETDRGGALTFRRVIQQNGWWVWPRIGTLDLRGWVLRVRAPGFPAATVDLAQTLPSLQLGEAEGRVQVRLRR